MNPTPKAVLVPGRVEARRGVRENLGATEDSVADGVSR